jgi:hypothetical protein
MFACDEEFEICLPPVYTHATRYPTAGTNGKAEFYICIGARCLIECQLAIWKPDEDVDAQGWGVHYELAHCDIDQHIYDQCNPVWEKLGRCVGFRQVEITSTLLALLPDFEFSADGVPVVIVGAYDGDSRSVCRQMTPQDVTWTKRWLATHFYMNELYH